VIWIIDIAVNVLSLAMRAGTCISRFPGRIWRLARFRSRASGTIPFSTQVDGAIHVSGRPRVKLGSHCRLGRDVFFETVGEGSVVIGDHVRINAGCFLVSYAGITIGNDCLIGEYASVRDADHGIAGDQPIRGQPHRSAPIVIEDNVWIGRGVAVLRGVRIGAGAVVGANSVVTRDVPAKSVVAGCPARVIRKRGEEGPGGSESPKGS
jgi:acetyltransferase-like isoleucine patch superfamily enzyme